MRSTSPTGSTERIKKLPFKKRLIKLLGRGFFWWLVTTSKFIGPRSVRFMGHLLGGLYYKCSRRYRELVIRQITQTLGDQYTQEQILAMSRQVFNHFCSEVFQFFRLLSMDSEKIDQMVEAEGYEHIDAALAEKHGCIIVTAHLGNWEMLARKLVHNGYTVSVIARDSDDPGMTGITTRAREKGGYYVFDRDQPIIGAFRRLKNNEILGILPDQNDYDGIEIEFFGKPALTATGPAVLSLKSGAALVPAYCEKLADDKYRLRAFPRIDFTPSGNHEEDVKNLTQAVMHSLEDLIKQCPAQWLWLHDRWKQRPGS